MPSPSLPEFRAHLERLKKDLLQVFAEGMRIPVPGNDCELQDLVDPEVYSKLEDYIDHYHAPILPPYEGFQPDSKIPLGSDLRLSLEGLLQYLEAHWLPRLTQTYAPGLGLHFQYEKTAPEGALTFSVGIHLTDKAYQRNPSRNEPHQLLHDLYNELEGPK